MLISQGKGYRQTSLLPVVLFADNPPEISFISCGMALCFLSILSLNLPILLPFLIIYTVNLSSSSLNFFLTSSTFILFSILFPFWYPCYTLMLLCGTFTNLLLIFPWIKSTHQKQMLKRYTYDTRKKRKRKSCLRYLLKSVPIYKHKNNPGILFNNKPI